MTSTTTTAKTRRRKTTKTGSRLALAALVVAQTGWTPVAAQKKADREVPAYGVIAGTVFRDTGFALAAAEIELAPLASPPRTKIKKQKEIANNRGEFVFRVPPGPMKYSVTASAKGFNRLQKEVTVHADERVDVTFVLEPSSNK